MSSKPAIIQAITSRVGGSAVSSWRIGLTHDLAERKQYWRITERQDTTHWIAWEADSLSDAQDIERHFINKGMKGGTGGDLSESDSKLMLSAPSAARAA